MFFSKRFILLLLLGVIPLILGIFFDVTIYVFILYNFIALTLYIVDLTMTPKNKLFEFERIINQKLSMGVHNDVTIKVRNKSKYNILFYAKDDIPESFQVDRYVEKLKVNSFSTEQIIYKVTPIKRGEYTFNILYVKYPGVLGLCIKNAKYNLQSSIKVYPNIKNMGQNIQMAIKMNDNMQGQKSVKQLGEGTEFESIREYISGDDYRKVNWNASARSGTMMVNTYQPERNLHIYIMLDTSRVMNSEIEQIKKLDYCVNAAFILAGTAMEKGDNVGLLAFDNEIIRYTKPGKGLSHFSLLAENLYNVKESYVYADYKKAFDHINKYQKRRSIIFLFTELLDSEQTTNIINSIKSNAYKHKVVVLCIKNQQLHSILTNRASNTDDIYLKSAALKYNEERSKMFDRLKASGIPYLESYYDKFSLNAAGKYLEIKSRGV